MKADIAGMRLLAILVVMAVIGLLASHQLGGRHTGTGTTSAGQQVLNDARSALTGAEAKQQTTQDTQDQSASQP